MTKIFNSRLLALFCLFVATCVGLSCEKELAKSDKIELLSFGPTGAMHGDTLIFIGNNLHQVTDIIFSGTTAFVPKSDFKQQTSEQILLLVPMEAERGFVTLKTPQGDIVSKTQLNLEVVPVVASITEEARPGETITITGQHMNWVTAVVFADDKVVDTTGFVTRSLNELVVTVPEDAQTGPLVLAFGGTEPDVLETTDTLKITLPMASAIAPNPVKHQTDLTITGTSLDLVKEIRFAGVSTPVTEFVSQSETELVVKVPGSTRKGKITFVAASGVTTESEQELDVVLPTVTSINPETVDPGANLTITGTNFDLVTSVTFANAPAVTSFVSKSATQIVVRVPMGVLRGRLILAVLNSTLTVESEVLEITGDAPPPTIALPIYKDGVTSNWNGWVGDGWGGTKNYDNTAPVREGTKSVKVDYVGGYGSPMQLGGANLSTSGYTTFKISLFGAPGSDGKRVNLGINGSDGPTITIVAGKWTDYEFPLSTLVPSGTITEILVKEYSGTGGFTVYVDALGLN